MEKEKNRNKIEKNKKEEKAAVTAAKHDKKEGKSRSRIETPPEKVKRGHADKIEKNAKKQEAKPKKSRTEAKTKPEITGNTAKKSKNGNRSRSSEKAGTGRTRQRRKMSDNQAVKAAPRVKIIPLGGMDRIGMNITAIETEESIVVIDCGISFPDETMLGIGKIIPDVTYLTDNLKKVKGFVITHGHEDHIGAIPYIIKQVNVPIYATKLTIGLIEHKLEEAHLLDITDTRVVTQGGRVELGDISVEFIRTNHSIAGASSLAITTPAGVLFHTGDFKIDYTPLFGDTIDLQRIAMLGREGVLAVMSDSTNAIRHGFTPSETMVANTIDTLFNQHKNSRIIVATFASNVDRVQQVILTAAKFGRKVIIQGRSMETVLEIASQLGYVSVPENTLISVDEMNNYPDDRLVFITTGSQGEAMAALSRMANSTHKKVSIKTGDAIVFSSNPIPGNEKAVSKVINELAEKGAKVIYQDTHVSGHACSQEIQLIYTLLKPKYAIPVHGEYRHLQAAAGLVSDLGLPHENIFLLSAGDVLELNEESAQVTGKVTAREVYIDGAGSADVGLAVIKDRQNLAEHGFVLITAAIEQGTGYLMARPQVTTRGFVYLKESEDIISGIEDEAMLAVERCIEKGRTDVNRIKSEICGSVGNYIWKTVQRDPIVMTSIIEI